MRDGDGVRWFRDITQYGVTAAGAVDGNASDGEDESAHEARATGGAHGLVGPVGLVADFDAEFHLVHLADADDLDVHVSLEVAAVVLVEDEFLQFEFEELDVLEGGAKVDGESELFLHGLGAADVFNPAGVEDDVGYLGDLVVIDVFEDGEEQGDALDDQAVAVDVDAVSNVIRMLLSVSVCIADLRKGAYLDE